MVPFKGMCVQSEAWGYHPHLTAVQFASLFYAEIFISRTNHSTADQFGFVTHYLEKTAI